MKWLWMLMALAAGMAVSIQGRGERRPWQAGRGVGRVVRFIFHRNDRFIFSAIVFRKRRVAGHVFCAEMAAAGRHSRRLLRICHRADRSESWRGQFVDCRDRRTACDEFDD